MNDTGREQAIANVKTAFTDGAKTAEQQNAVLDLVKPRKFNQYIRLFDASGVKEYPGTEEGMSKKAGSILGAFLKSGDAPKAVIDYVGVMAGQITATHQVRINRAFEPA